MLARLHQSTANHDTFPNTQGFTILTAERQVQGCVVFLFVFFGKKKSQKRCVLKKFLYLQRQTTKKESISDFFHNLYIVFPLLFPHQEGFFVFIVTEHDKKSVVFLGQKILEKRRFLCCIFLEKRIFAA